MRFQFLLFIFLSLFIKTSLNAQPYNACVKNTAIHIVVLGSSTAAGSGPSSLDSAWVNRYRKHLQTINSQNLVTNLAIGGTTTYHIMPDWFSATNKPTRNTSNNISQAVRLGADAVIVNMPSNDASNGFGATEQLFNFRTIKAVADSFNIPIWICTTQPKNFSLTSSKQIQIDVKDSVLLQYGNNALDFWNGFADSTNGIKGIYDSGDGTHLNDLAHRELNNRVINKLIPNYLTDTLGYTDFVVNLYNQEISCGDSTEIVSVIVTNLGIQNTSSLTVQFEVTDLSTAQTTLYPVTLLGNPNSCESDTVQLSLNTYFGANFKIRGYIDSIDTNSVNDTTSTILLKRIGHPTISANDVYHCPNDSVLLTANTLPQHTIVWYDSAASTQALHLGNTYSFFPTALKKELFAQAVAGPLHYKKTLDLTKSTNVNWNGYMFDIVPNDTITLDSFDIHINTTGDQKVIAYYRRGSHRGFENNAPAWIYWGIDSSTIITVGDLAQLNYSDLILTPNDTFGVYLHLQNSSSTLSYQRATTPSVFSDQKISVPSGSGVSNTFGAIYYPRDISALVNYHYGFNPLGDCQSTRIMVSAIESKPYLNLGRDTVLYAGDSIQLTQNNFNSYLWSNGSSNHQIVVSRSTFGVGTHTIWLEATDSIGCLNRDTIVVTISFAIGLEEQSNIKIKITPNPSQGSIQLKGFTSSQGSIQLYNTLGKLVFQSKTLIEKVNLEHLPKGIYYLSVEQNKSVQTEKIILH